MAKRRTADPIVEQYKAVLSEHYLPKHPNAKIDVYRYSPYSVRVRVIDPVFTGKLITRRDGEIWDIFKSHVSLDDLQDLTLLLLLAPGEEKQSLSNIEFENPTPV